MINKPTGRDSNRAPTEGIGSESSTRRAILKAGGATLALGAAGWMSNGPQPATAAPPSQTETTLPSCVLSPQVTEGPYYVPGALIRRDITEGKPGVPLRLRITILDAATCTPLPDAAVDIWHCDAQGYYSAVSGELPGGGGEPSSDENLTTTFLRGMQLTDAAGVAEFETIYPGWYIPRAVHIHMKVHAGGSPDSTYEGGHVAHSGQLYFDDAISDGVFVTAAYAGRPSHIRYRNTNDILLGDAAAEPGVMLGLAPLVEGSVEDGFLGAIIVSVDPTAAPFTPGVPASSLAMPSGD